MPARAFTGRSSPACGLRGRSRVRSLLMPACRGAETAAEFYQGKQVRFYTMGSPGGGYDTYMRALVPHLEKQAWRQDAADERAGGGRPDRDEPHDECRSPTG